MNILLVYANEVSEGFLPMGLAMISAVLKRAGHNVSLFDTSFFDTGAVQVRELREKYLEFKKVKGEDQNVLKREKKDLAEEFKKSIRKNNPGLIAVGCTSIDFYFILPYLREIKKTFDVPILIGGPHATVAPESTIKEDCVDMVCVGEGEEAIVELVDRMGRNEDHTNVKNIWVKKDGEIYRNEVRPLIQNLDSLPFPDWDLFDPRHLKRPFHGEIKHYGFFEFTRGCPYTCTYCINTYLRNMYKGKGEYHREKSVERIIAEIEEVKNKFGLDHIQFVDDTFLLMEINKLKKFVSLFNERKIKATIFIMSRAETINEATVKLLKEWGCTMVAIGVETGNEEFRAKVCKRFMKNLTIIKAFKLLKRNGIKTESFNIIGFPYETRKLIFDTIKLNHKIKPDQFTLRFLYPFEGTEIKKMCVDAGFFPEEGMDPRVYHENSVLKMPQISPRELKGLRKTAPLYVRLPYIIWPLIRVCEKENFISNIIYNLLAKFVRA